VFVNYKNSVQTPLLGGRSINWEGAMSTTSCTVVGSFKIPTGETCELLAFCQPGEGRVGGRTMLARGQADKASMDEAAFQKFWKHRTSVPDEFADRYYFAFPEASGALGDVRYAVRDFGDWDRDRGGLGGGWGDGDVLVRFGS